MEAVMIHRMDCKAYNNYQPPYEDCTCGVEAIERLEQSGDLDPTCNMCKKIFYQKIQNGVQFGYVFAPRHKPSKRCESGKHPHCTCDTCF